jgi:hypothetical protein
LDSLHRNKPWQAVAQAGMHWHHAGMKSGKGYCGISRATFDLSGRGTAVNRTFE